jgi:predicted ATPase/DNA-binding CsgD family transcriptional regulator
MSANSGRETAFQLPYPATRLFGRERDIAAVSDLLLQSDVRLVTLTGPGGVGKTRLGLAVGEHLKHEYRDGVVFVELAPLRDPSHVPSTIAQALEVRERAEQPILEGLQSALREQELLLFLDNFEHLLDAAGDVAQLLSSCPNLTILVTSRARMQLRAEHQFPVQPLSFPDQRLKTDHTRAIEYDSVALFVERARATRPEFHLSVDNVEAVSEICTRLDGLPLAVELAASRVHLFSPEHLLRRLEHRLPTLATGPRDLPQRQQTLRSAIAWSYDLLSPEQQTVFKQLAVFHGPWTIQAAEAVIGDSEIDIVGSVETFLLHNLIVRAGEIHGDPGFSMLETIREFAAEQLSDSGGLHETRSRHAEWMLAFAESQDRGLRFLSSYQAQLVSPDVRAAIEWMNEQGDPERHLRLVANITTSLSPTFVAFGEGLRWLEQALDRTGSEHTLARSRALSAAGMLTNLQGNEVRATGYLTNAIEMARPFGRSRELAWALMLAGEIAQEQGDYSDALTLLNEALSVAQDLEDLQLEANISLFLALVASGLGEHERAIRIAENAVARARRSDTIIRRWESPSLNVLGLTQLAAGKPEAAAKSFGDGIRQNIYGGFVLVLNLAGLSHVVQSLGHPIRSATLGGLADGFCERLNAVLIVPERDLHREAIDNARVALDDERFREAEETGRKMTPDEGVAFALETVEILQGVREPVRADGYDADLGLTPRETEVLRLIAQGMSDREIADALFISHHTVMRHVSHILTKLDVRSRAAATRVAVEQGLLRHDETEKDPEQ